MAKTNRIEDEHVQAGLERADLVQHRKKTSQHAVVDVETTLRTKAVSGGMSEQ